MTDALRDSNRVRTLLLTDDTSGAPVRAQRDSSGRLKCIAVIADGTSIQKVQVTKNSGAVVGTRKTLNFIEGSNITLTIADDAGDDEVDITIASPSVGDVVGPASSTDAVPALFDGTTGKLLKNSSPTGTGNPVLATSPVLTTPTLGVATATSINKVAFTSPATGATLTLADGKTLTCNNTLTFTGTDSSSVAFGTGGTVAYTNVTALASLTTVGTLVGGNATGVVDAASTTASGKVELTIASEVTTGTDATRAVTPDSLAGSDYGIRLVEIQVIAAGTATSIGDGAGSVRFFVPAQLNGYNLVAAHAAVITAGTTNTTDIQIANVTQAADMLTTKITIDSGEKTSYTAATAPVIDTGNDDVATGDEIRIDVDAISTTPAQGLCVILGFQLP